MTRSTRQTTWCVGRHEQRLCVMSNHASALPQRSGFTLVELLVVITIIGVLAALITPAVFQARRSGQISAIKAEIDLLHMAMMHYKNEYGSFPPCTGLAAARSHVQRLFPRVSSINAEVPATSVPTPQTALHDWLQGYSKNPTAPRTSTPLVKLFEFDQSRVTTANQFHPREKTGSPYVYIDSANYSTASFGTCDAEPGFNSDTFQILCAGLDETWGTDDDLSNFWKGTRGDQ
ncbi:prepilin-type N-terminal cleavage/methylation domain-containing protein [Pirellulales bacterium]|nr:prepilin-type N-terminal cleavage/methylation domain-containing protein [Pirellulales bacterium]